MNSYTSLLKKQRVMNYFLEAASEIASESGLDSITIRNVSERAGYNSATLYNYFENLDELVAFTVIRHISAYLTDISVRITNYKDNPIGSHLCIWRSLCLHSFRYPHIFSHAYASSYQEMDFIQSKIMEYTDIFPETFSGHFDQDILKTFFVSSSAEHDRMIMQPLIDLNILTLETIDELNYYATVLYNGLLNKAINLKDKTPEEYTNIFLNYYYPYVESKVNPKYMPSLNDIII